VSNEQTRTLFRPVGLRELELILDSEARAFPPRLPEQPIFYPVLNEAYAEQIARDWNTPDEVSGYAGFVTAFDAGASFLARYDTKVVGASQHQELWVPAEELPEFNRQLRSPIRVTKAFYGKRYRGPQPVPAGIKEPNPRGQLRLLRGMRAYNTLDFVLEIAANWKLVLCNYGYWRACPATEQGLSDADAAQTLEDIRGAWEQRRSDLPLPTGQLHDAA
jgi:hypothetical protein